jgi:hypothetical protein
MPAHYHLAVFTPDGELQGTRVWNRSDLSSQWLGVCAELLRNSASSWRVAVPFENLEHLEIRCTHSSGVGLATYYARGELAVSTLLLRGDHPVVEAEVVAMFLASLGRVQLVQRLGALTRFRTISSMDDRPLHAVIVWGNPAVSDDDAGLIQELTAHFAGAMLTA